MKIVFVIAQFGFGGAQRVVAQLANSFVAVGHNVEIVTANYDRMPAFTIDARISRINITVGGLPGIISINTCRSLRALLIKSKPNVVISFISEMNTLVLLASRGLKIPVIVSNRNDPNMVPHNIVKKLARDIAYNLADGLVFQTDAAKGYFNKDIQSRSTVILNPLDTQTLPAACTGQRTKRIVAVNKLSPQKNIPSLIKAFALVSPLYPDYQLNIYGDGVLKEELAILVSSLGLASKVIFMGNNPSVLDLISDASMFVLASDYEGMPNVLIEAMAMGLPCISTNCPIGGPALLVEHNVNGLLVPVNDHVSLANSMLELLDDPVRADSLGKEAIKIRERVDSVQISSEWENYIRVVINRKEK